MRLENSPTRLGAAWFQFRATCFRLRRAAAELVSGRAARLTRDPTHHTTGILAESVTLLSPSVEPAEFALQAGKIQNLRVAARELDGIIIPAGSVFSFWRNLGRATRRRGFVKGRELREGCVIPNIGGGLCQLSNALYDVALRSDCEIVERHAHSQKISEQATPTGRDATIFWNYIDLRFAPRTDCQLRIKLSRGELTVTLHSLNSVHALPPVAPVPHVQCETRQETAESCETCGVTTCFRNPSASSLPRRGVAAWLVDKFEPEFDQWISQTASDKDWLFLPLNSKSVEGYRWSKEKFARIKHAPLVTLARSFKSRRLATQGAERQRALLGFDAALAETYARKIPTTADHLVVSLNLLPHLWRSGQLGGRTFDVLMTRTPISQLQRRLDLASSVHPESKTLIDFRANAAVAAAEEEALAAARFCITPHSEIAEFDSTRTIHLAWAQEPAQPVTSRKGKILFPASTLARKGCYELREVARQLGLGLRVTGPILEHSTFWSGMDVESGPANTVDGVAMAVLPAWVEHWPRGLLRLAASGVPVIASTACGLRGVPTVTEVPLGDVDRLRSEIEAALLRIRA